MKKFGLLLFIGMVVVALAIDYLPWWALLLGFVALILTGKFLLKKVLLHLFLKPFQLKGAVLKDATAEVNSVTPVDTPVAAVGEADQTTSRTRYCVDVTIRPGSADTPFAAWEPGSMFLVSPESVLDRNVPPPAEEDVLCEVESVEVEQDGRFQPDEGMKFQGPQRLKLTIAVKPGTPALKFRYYFEDFGCVTLLEPPLTRAA